MTFLHAQHLFRSEFAKHQWLNQIVLRYLPVLNLICKLLLTLLGQDCFVPVCFPTAWDIYIYISFHGGMNSGSVLSITSIICV